MPNSLMSPKVAHAADVLVVDQMAVAKGESVVITADTATDPMVSHAVMNAAYRCDAKVAIVLVPQLPFQGGLADPYVADALEAAVAACDVWVDLTWPSLVGATAHQRAMESGRVRYLLAADLTRDPFFRLYGNIDMDRLFDVQAAFDAVVEAAIGKQCRITNDKGTDISFTMAKPGYEKLRRANKPSLNAVPGSGMIYPEMESVEGVIVIDAAFHEYYTRLSPPISLNIRGKIQSISGGGTEAVVMDRALRRPSAGEYGYVIHLSCGFHPAARYTGGCFIEDIRVTGNNAVGLGLPWWLPGGGENHPDAVVSRQSLWIDGRQIVEEGRIIGPPDLASAYDRLTPLYR